MRVYKYEAQRDMVSTFADIFIFHKITTVFVVTLI